MITKLSLSKTAAGLGTANIFFSTLENIQEINEPDIKASHIFGAETKTTAKKDKATTASPNWVKLYCILGNWDNLKLR